MEHWIGDNYWDAEKKHWDVTAIQNASLVLPYTESIYSFESILKQGINLFNMQWRKAPTYCMVNTNNRELTSLPIIIVRTAAVPENTMIMRHNVIRNQRIIR